MIREYIIGREKGTDSPRLAVYFDGNVTYLGRPGCVPQSVSREHCKLTIDDEGKIKIEDITSNNYIYVDGAECKKRGNLSPDDVLELGPDHFKLNVGTILKEVNSQMSWHIGHLEKIYDDYQQEKIDDQVRRAKLNAYSMLPGVLSMASLGLTLAFPNSPTIRGIMIASAAVLMVVFLLIRLRSASADPIAAKEKEDKFRSIYVCPNPACGHFLGPTPYRDILKGRMCPYCRSKFIR